MTSDEMMEDEQTRRENWQVAFFVVRVLYRLAVVTMLAMLLVLAAEGSFCQRPSTSPLPAPPIQAVAPAATVD